MGGGGFMQHAQETNKQDRAQKEARRGRYKGHLNERKLSDEDQRTALSFSHLSPEQIKKERKRVRQYTHRSNLWYSILVVAGIALILAMMIKTYLYLSQH